MAAFPEGGRLRLPAGPQLMMRSQLVPENSQQGRQPQSLIDMAFTPWLTPCPLAQSQTGNAPAQQCLVHRHSGTNYLPSSELPQSHGVQKGKWSPRSQREGPEFKFPQASSSSDSVTTLIYLSFISSAPSMSLTLGEKLCKFAKNENFWKRQTQ